MKPERLAKWEGKIRPFATAHLPKDFVIRRYSRGRERFLDRLDTERPEWKRPAEEHARKLWGHVEVGGPLMNAAGMWKNGRGYEVSARQGAGAHMIGTTTHGAREGYQHQETGERRTFTPYPRSGAASNTLGLPNDGHEAVAQRVEEMEPIRGCPVAVSVMRDDDNVPEEEAVELLIEGMRRYEETGKVGWLEVNESCPNTGHGELKTDEMEGRLQVMRRGFTQESDTPVVVKLSVDTEPEQVPELLDILYSNEVSGVNFGNTRTDYDAVRGDIHPRERPLFDHYVEKHEGGVSGRPLKERAWQLASRAAMYRDDEFGDDDFMVFRTGGIEGASEVRPSETVGIDMNQWFTGYFDGFEEHGHDVYSVVHADLSDESTRTGNTYLRQRARER